MYVVYGNGKVSVSQLAADGLSVVKTQQVLQASDVNTETVEGNRMYNINGTYYILNDQPGSTTYIWKSSSPWGPYEAKILGQNIAPPLEGGNSPHQGSLIKTAQGDCELGPTWEWNHNPDVASFEINNGVTLRTASVTEDIYSARKTRTHRIHGEFPKGTVEIDFSNMADGDRFGLAAFRDQTAYIGIHRNGSEYALKAIQGIIIDEWSGNPVDSGKEVASAPVPSGVTKVWFRAELDARPTGTRDADFFYSFDGVEFTKLGDMYELYSGWAFFIAYRFGIFNFATTQLGGSIKVNTFTAA
ncbi:xylosidase glycosyl [Colletotrichum acutatum]